MTIPLNPQAYLIEIQPLFSGDPVELTDVWQNLGGRINTKGADGIAAWLSIVANSSLNISFRVLCYKTATSVKIYNPPIYLITDEKVYLTEEGLELKVAADQNPILDIYLGSYVPYVQIQVKDSNNQDGQITEADVSFRLGQITHV